MPQASNGLHKLLMQPTCLNQEERQLEMHVAIVLGASTSSVKHDNIMHSASIGDDKASYCKLELKVVAG